MSEWISVDEELPERGQLVSIRVDGTIRPRYYHIAERWYYLDDLDRWNMTTARYYADDVQRPQGPWYLKTSDLTHWKEPE